MENQKETSAERLVENGVSHAVQTEPSPLVGELLPSATDHDVMDEAELDPLPVDYSSLSKKELLTVVEELLSDTNVKKADAVLREVKSVYDELFEKEKSEALQRFREADGVAEGFEYKGDEVDQAFELVMKAHRDRRNQFFKTLEEQKTGNLARKQEILDKLRALTDQEDTENGFHQFKQLQHEWKAIGPVATAHVKTLWANYTALVDRFYDHRSIYFELKELDRKKNLQAKLELCERAEKLIHLERLKDAVKELNELHSEFRHLGPVPKEEQEAVWQRFKVASDAIYTKRDALLSVMQETLQKNLNEKLALAEQLHVFSTFQSDRIKEWNQKTQEILEMQKKWEAVGAIPRAKAREVNRKFWTVFKAFFANKSAFFRKLDDERGSNLKLKNELIQKAQALSGNEDWDKTANELKELQRQWKEIGPVPEKMREKIFAEFKKACDQFFEQRRAQFDKADKELEENLKAKEVICAELELQAMGRTGSLEHLKSLQNRYNEIGFVPKKAVNAIRTRFNAAVDKLLSTLELSGDQKDRARLEVQMGNLKNDPNADRKIFHKEQSLRKHITTIENDIAVLRNNLEFFARSKNADKVREEFNAKIDEATEQLKELKGQLKVIRAI